MSVKRIYIKYTRSCKFPQRLNTYYCIHRIRWIACFRPATPTRALSYRHIVTHVILCIKGLRHFAQRKTLMQTLYSALYRHCRLLSKPRTNVNSSETIDVQLFFDQRDFSFHFYDPNQCARRMGISRCKGKSENLQIIADRIDRLWQDRCEIRTIVYVQPFWRRNSIYTLNNLSA